MNQMLATSSKGEAGYAHGEDCLSLLETSCWDPLQYNEAFRTFTRILVPVSEL